MSDEPTIIKNDIISEVIPEVISEVNVEPIVDTKRSKKLEQLSQARQSAKNKKRQRDEDLDYMKKKIDDLSSILLEQKQKEAPIQEEEDISNSKRQRVTKETEEEEEAVSVQRKDGNEEESWSTSLIRTSAVLSLGAASWYMSNCYGKATKKKDEKKNIKKTKTPTSMLPYEVQRKHSVTVIGKSGFTK